MKIVSRYRLVPNQDNHEVIVGWDPTMITYFARVIDVTKDVDQEGRDVLWVGVTSHDICDLELFEEIMRDYAWVSDDQRRQLYADANA